MAVTTPNYAKQRMSWNKPYDLSAILISRKTNGFEIIDTAVDITAATISLRMALCKFQAFILFYDQVFFVHSLTQYIWIKSTQVYSRFIT